jgi:hypothetical protein
MRKLLLVPEDEYLRFKKALREVIAAANSLSQAGSMTLDISSEGTIPVDVTNGKRDSANFDLSTPPKYEISRGFGWAEAVAREVHDDIFEVSTAREKLRQFIAPEVIDAPGVNRRIRRALVNDDRFEQSQKDPNRFRRV